MTELWHVMPVGDLREHETATTCWCAPEIDGDDGICIHNSLDGREHTKERGIIQ